MREGGGGGAAAGDSMCSGLGRPPDVASGSAGEGDGDGRMHLLITVMGGSNDLGLPGGALRGLV